MNRFLLTGLTAATMFFINISHADFTFHSMAPDSCEHVTGQWAGTGEASNWILGSCTYHGIGSTGPIDLAGNFIISVVAEKESGSYLCPSTATKQLVGNCINGVVTIMTEYGNLNGNFSSTAGDANGRLYVGPGIYADVSLQFQRVE